MAILIMMKVMERPKQVRQTIAQNEPRRHGNESIRLLFHYREMSIVI